jgi:N-methylhydantoinase B
MDVRFAMPVWRDGAHLLLAVEHRPLARHRRHGAGRLLGLGHLGRAGGAAPAPGQALQARRDGPEIYAIICSNIRVADQRIGDVKAQASALLVGEERLTALLDRYGDATVTEAIAEMRGAATQMRAMIALIPTAPGAARPSSTATGW